MFYLKGSKSPRKELPNMHENVLSPTGNRETQQPEQIAVRLHKRASNEKRSTSTSRRERHARE